jgi:predicted neuraminidase
MKTSLILFLLFLFSIPCNAQQWKVVQTSLIAANAPFKSCHASTIVQLPDGELMAAWFAGEYEGAKDVCIWTAITEDGKWQAPAIVATGKVNDTTQFPCWNPVLFRDRNDKLFLYYKVGPSPQKWWGMFISSDDNGNTWSAPVRLPAGILGPIKNKPIQLKDGSIISPSSTETSKLWSVHIERSTNNGNSWKKIPVPTKEFQVIQPSVLTYKDGRLQMLCRSKEGVVVQSWSKDGGRSWSKPARTKILNPNSGIDAVSLANGYQMLVYNPDIPGKEWYNGRAKLNVAVSKDGLVWKDVLVLENGDTQEFSYPAVIQAENGLIQITYTYQRKNIRHVVLREFP